MSEHQINHRVERGQHWATCKCERWKSGIHAERWMVEDEAIIHLRNVEKAKAALSRRQPGLAGQARYYRQMEEADPDVKQRPLWRQLAEELEQRLAEKTLPDDENQPPLF